jgi:hypothetical protein
MSPAQAAPSRGPQYFLAAAAAHAQYHELV